jgi:hypothetical protein
MYQPNHPDIPNDIQQLVIDNEAKMRVPLMKMTDTHGQPYYIGKLQFGGALDFRQGNSFMVFVSEEGVEELQIGPIDPSKKSKNIEKFAVGAGGRLCIALHPSTDQLGKVFYVGELMCEWVNMPMINGVFFTIFLSRPGYEEIQISKLVPFKKKFNRYNDQASTGKYGSPRSNWDVPTPNPSIPP